MEFSEVMKIKSRMCNVHKYCHDCPMSNAMHDSGAIACNRFISTHPDEAELILIQWDLVYPKKKTRLQDIMDRYPDLITVQMGRPHVCAVNAGYIKQCPGNISCSACWSQEVD